MRLIAFAIRLVLFLLVLLFALANTHSVSLTLIPGVTGLTFEAPMALWMLGIFALGVLVCFLYLLPTLVAAWRKPAKDLNGN
jgi:uncharacterized integral membrane protein